MRRVLYLSSTTRVGGAEESLLGLLAALDRSQVQPLLACPPLPSEPGDDAGQGSAGPVSSPEPDLANRARSLGVEVIALPLARLTRTWNPARLSTIYRNILACRRRMRAEIAHRKIDLIHANSPTAALHAAGAPLICHLRDLRLPWIAGRVLAGRTACVVATSSAVANLARKRICERVRRIPNGVDPDEFRPGCGCAGSEPYALMIAHMVPWKRHDLFLECMARMRSMDAGIRGMVVGADLFEDQGSHVRRLMERARDLGLHHAITWRNNVSRKEMAGLVAGAGVLVHPAAEEPFGRAVMEAMSSATPVVAIDAAGPRELLQNGGGVLCTPGDIDAMARAAFAYITDPQRANAAGARGRQVVLESYTIEKHARAMEALYGETGKAFVQNRNRSRG